MWYVCAICCFRLLLLKVWFVFLTQWINSNISQYIDPFLGFPPFTKTLVTAIPYINLQSCRLFTRNKKYTHDTNIPESSIFCDNLWIFTTKCIFITFYYYCFQKNTFPQQLLITLIVLKTAAFLWKSGVKIILASPRRIELLLQGWKPWVLGH